MKIIVVFWCNMENFCTVLRRDIDLTVQEQVNRWAISRKATMINNYFGHEMTLEE